MLQSISLLLSQQRIVLASASPRRKEILGKIGLVFDVVPSTFSEDLVKSDFKLPVEYAQETSKHKALDVATSLKDDLLIPSLVIGADTIVTQNGKIYEKPKNRENAIEMLTSFNGKYHEVHTAVTLVTNITTTADSFKVTQFSETTKVKFAELPSHVIEAYVDTGESMDKAGGYGIQGAGGSLVEAIEGDFYNVMGFPLHRFSKTLLALYQNKTSSHT